jgi:hypothetical protein
MIIPIFWSQKATIPNLEELLANYRQHGGAIVQYERVLSAVIYSQRTHKFEWVGPGTTRRAVGCKHALWCFFLGWWSITGFVWTAGAILNNLMGGIDVTRVLTSPPPLPGQPHDTEAIRELQAARKRQQYVFLAFLLGLLVLVLIFFVLPNI